MKTRSSTSPFPNHEPDAGAFLCEQFKACDVTIAWSLAATLIVKTISGLRPMAENTEPGLDLAEHGGQGCER